MYIQPSPKHTSGGVSSRHFRLRSFTNPFLLFFPQYLDIFFSFFALVSFYVFLWLFHFDLPQFVAIFISNSVFPLYFILSFPLDSLSFPFPLHYHIFPFVPFFFLFLEYLAFTLHLFAVSCLLLFPPLPSLYLPPSIFILLSVHPQRKTNWLSFQIQGRPNSLLPHHSSSPLTIPRPLLYPAPFLTPKLTCPIFLFTLSHLHFHQPSIVPVHSSCE